MTLANIFLKFGVFFEVVIATNDIQQNIKPTEVISLIILSCFVSSHRSSCSFIAPLQSGATFRDFLSAHATGQNYCSKITGDDGDADQEFNDRLQGGRSIAGMQ